MKTRLLRVESETHWSTYHSIRQHVLYELRGRNGYDENHPDEYKEQNIPLLFLWDDQHVGTVRLDQENENTLGVVRLVAILPNFQRQGIGTAMMQEIETFAANRGIRQLKTQAAKDAITFYEKLGWHIIDSSKRNPLMLKILP